MGGRAAEVPSLTCVQTGLPRGASSSHPGSLGVLLPKGRGQAVRGVHFPRHHALGICVGGAPSLSHSLLGAVMGPSGGFW